MKSSLSSLLLAVSGTLLAPATALNTVWLAGDSTMAPLGTGQGTEGWGQYLKYSLNPAEFQVNNMAKAGRSARTFTNEGRFQTIADGIKKGDWVVIELGLNDGPGNPATDTTKNRVDCPGMGSETCPVVVNGKTEVVQTYNTYLHNAASKFLSLGAKVIIASSTPRDPYANGAFSFTPPIYSWYSWEVVKTLGGPKAGIYFVPHGQYCAQTLKIQGSAFAAKNYPIDHTHLSPLLADTFSHAFVLGLKCGTSPLKSAVINATTSAETAKFGTCLSVNSTLPI